MSVEQVRKWALFTALAAAMSFSAIGTSLASDALGAVQEAGVLQKYCGSCHSDALMYGGLSVQHFDTGHPDPTLTAMLLNKLTRGHTPQDVLSSDSEGISKMMKGSAMGAAGNGVPDVDTQVALSRTLAQQSKGAYEWNAAWSDGLNGQDRTLVVSTLREKPSVQREGATDSYRLTVSCRPATRESEVKLTWADFAAEEGKMMSVAIDNAAPFQHKVEGGRAQGNGDGGLGATILKIPLPEQNLRLSSLFSEGSIEFPFSKLSPALRRDLSVCFSGDSTAQ